MKTIGLLGGMSWESSALYYEILNQEVQKRLGGLHSARCVMLSVDFQTIEELQHRGHWEAAGKLLAADARRIEAAGARVQAVPTADGHVDIDAVMAQLGRGSVASCLIEGGSRISAAALAAGVIDKLMLFLAPKLLGGSDGVPLFRGRGAGVMADARTLHRLRVRRIENDVLIEGYLQGPGSE